MSPLAASALIKMLYSSLAAGVGVAVVFSIAVYGAVRSSDMRREHKARSATAYSLLTAAGLVASAAIVAYGLYLLAHKA
jgi:hypothetical protein